VNPTTYAGAAVSSPSGGSVITFSGGVPTDLDPTSMLEISNGDQEGWWSAIVSSTATTVTVLDVFPAGLAANVQATVRKFSTIQDVFGNNTPGLAPFSNTLPYDNIQVLDPVNQSSVAIAYVNGQWEDLGSEAPAGSLIIYPGTAVKVIHRANTTLPVVVTGSVKPTKTQVDLFANDNWVGQPNPTGGTFGSMNLGTQIVPSTDIVSVFLTDTGPGQVAQAFVRVGTSMEDAATEENADAQPIPEGGGYVLTRPTSGSSTITIPAQPIAP
jgi:hypothetical protein